MSTSTIFDIIIKDRQKYVVGYSTVCKTRCEIYNFVSPTLRILRFTEGSAQWRIDRTVECFCAGDVVILNNLNKRNIHKILSDSITYELFDFYPSLLSSEQLWSVFYQDTHKVSDIEDPDASNIFFLLDKLKKEILHPQDSWQIFCIQRLLELLTLEFLRKIEMKSDNKFNASLFNLTKCIQYISEHLNEDLNITDLAKRYGYSPEYFSRMFKKYLGMAPIHYIINLRLENVLQLVDTEHITILDAAYRSGFRSSSAFYKAFQAYHSTSPTKYKG